MDPGTPEGTVRILRLPVGRNLHKGTALLCAAVLLVVGDAWPLLDLDYTTDGTHVEVPNGPTHEHGTHNHALCGIMASAHVLPGDEPQALLPGSREATCLPIAAGLFQRTVRYSVHRSRAPPTI